MSWTDGPRWYAVETIHNSEHVAFRNLIRQGFETFCPRIKVVRRHARKSTTVLAPVFPGYLFVKFDPCWDPWRAINSTVGVRRLVSIRSSYPAPIPSEIMEELLHRCPAGVMDTLLPNPAPGQRVRLIAGALAGRMATIERLDRQARVRVLLEILGGETSVDIDLASLMPVRAYDI